MKEIIPFNRAWHAPKEISYMTQAVAGAWNGASFSDQCVAWLEKHTGARAAYLTHSCTAALEMAAILAGIGPGDEVIMPSFTFPSTANAFVLRGGIPVFVDIRQDTLNLNEDLIEAAVTARTKAIVPVHYAGIACNMNAIMAIADRHNLLVIEDAAQGIGATYGARPLGSIGHMAAYSFHKTKNIQCESGGALLLNEGHFVGKADIISEKGTNRKEHRKGATERYTWKDVGSSFLMSEIHAAMLMAQLEDIPSIQEARGKIWWKYYRSLLPLEDEGLLRLPTAAEGHNAHIFYILAGSAKERGSIQAKLRQAGIEASTHYEPLHNSAAGKAFSRSAGAMHVTEAVSDRLLRLPLWNGMTDAHTDRVIEALYNAIR